MLKLYFVNRQSTIIYAANDEDEALSTFLLDLEKSGVDIDKIDFYCMPLGEKDLSVKRPLVDMYSKETHLTSFKDCLDNLERLNFSDETMDFFNQPRLFCVLNN